MAMRKQEVEISVDCVCLCGETSQLDDVDSEDCRCQDCEEARMEACVETYGGDKVRGKENRQGKVNGAQSKNRKTVQFREEGIAKDGSPSKTRIHEKRQSKQEHRTTNSHKNSNLKTLDDQRMHQKTSKQAHRETLNKHTTKRKQIPIESPKCNRYQREHFKLDYEMPTEPMIPDLPELLPEAIDIKPTEKDYNQAQMQYFVNQKIKENLLKHQQYKANQKYKKLEEQKKIKERLEILDLVAKKQLQQEAAKIDPNQPKQQKPKAPWNYTEKPEEVKIEKHCHKVPLKPKTVTGNHVDHEEIEKKKFINSLKKMIKEEYNQMKGIRRRSQDQIKPCSYHQVQEDLAKIAERNKKIEANAKKCIEKMQQQRKKEQDEERLRKAKLKGLSLEAKKKLYMSKKQDNLKDRPSFNYDATRQKIDYGSEKAQGLTEKNQEVPHPAQVQQQEIQFQDNRQKNKAKGSKKQSKSKSKDQIHYQAYEQDQHQRAEQRGPFFMWDVPIHPEQAKEVFTLGKTKTKQTQNQKFRKQVQDHIQSRMRKKVDAQIKKTKQEKYRQQISRKKAELANQYSGKKIPATGPGLSDVQHLKKDLNKGSKKGSK